MAYLSHTVKTLHRKLKRYFDAVPVNYAMLYEKGIIDDYQIERLDYNVYKLLKENIIRLVEDNIDDVQIKKRTVGYIEFYIPSHEFTIGINWCNTKDDTLIDNGTTVSKFLQILAATDTDLRENAKDIKNIAYHLIDFYEKENKTTDNKE